MAARPEHSARESSSERVLDELAKWSLSFLQFLDRAIDRAADPLKSRLAARCERDDIDARAKEAANDPRVQRLIAESAQRHALGLHGEPDSPESLDARLARLT
jgi:hypothetical protein